MQPKYNTKVAANASALINKINLKYLNYAFIYENDINEINKNLNFKASEYNFQKDVNYSFFLNKDLSLDKKKNVLDFIKYLKNK